MAAANQALEPVALTGGSAGLEEASLAFGSVTVGGARTLTARLQNSGSAPLAAAVGAAPAAFSVAHDCPATLSAGAGCALNVTFQPGAAQAYSGTLTATLGGTPVVLALSGTGDTSNRYNFTQVLSGVTAMAAGVNHTLALKSDGTLWATGQNGEGQLGTGNTTNRNSFTQVLSGVTTVAVGYTHTLALKNDGTLWVAGRNGEGQLGTGDQTTRTAFVRINP